MSLTSVRAIHLFPVALLLQPVFGQQNGASPQPSATPAPAPAAAVPSPSWAPEPPATDREEASGPVYVSGRVMSDDGQPFTDRVAIESVCDGVTRTEGYADKKGDFGVRVDGRIF
jgi:hypothetical protein